MKQVWNFLANSTSSTMQSGNPEPDKFLAFLTCEAPMKGEKFSRSIRLFIMRPEELRLFLKPGDIGYLARDKEVRIRPRRDNDDRRIRTLREIARKLFAGKYQPHVDYKMLELRRKVQEEEF